MADLLELIDHAIEDYETSQDAMRWTPEPAKPARHPVYGIPVITEWQARVLSHHLAEAFRPIAEWFEHLGAAMTRLFDQIRPLLDQPPGTWGRKHHARPPRHVVRHKHGGRR